MPYQICSVDAEEELKAKLTHVKEMLTFLNTEVERYESLQMVHYGHVGDMAHVSALLAEAADFLATSTN